MIVKVWGIHYNRGRSHSSLVQVSRRFVKKQQMHWTLEGAHLLLQIRTKVLNNEWEDVFRRWYPQFRTQEKAAA